jgi:aminoglycoside phosphotransferase (APT) family kinase protein
MVRSLLVDQHPDLAALPLEPLDAGWDNSLWRLGGQLVVRLPRRAIAAPLVLHEQRWLPSLAPLLPLPVPVPLRVGVASATFRWPWSIVPWLEGVPGDRARLTDPGASAGRLGHFFRALHCPAPPDAPVNPYRGVAIGKRQAVFEDRLASLAGEVDEVGLREVWRHACDAPAWSDPPVWLANMLFVDGVLSGVIDFGDICAGDPATDLSAAWMLLPTGALPTFLRAYDRADAALIARARGWAVVFGLMVLGIGLHDKPTYEPIGRATLIRAVTT